MNDATFIRAEGEGRPLVLVHGVGLDHGMWDPVMGYLTDSRRVIRYDLIGHGRTPDQPGLRSIRDFVAQLVGVLDSCGLESPDIAGLSLGGLITMGMAARHPDRVGRIALLNTAFRRNAEQQASIRRRLALAREEGLATMAGMAVDRWFTAAWQAEHPEQVEAVRQRLAGNDPDSYLKAYQVFVDGDPGMPEGAALIDAPMLAMTGELDPGSTPAMSVAMAGEIPNGQARILIGLHHLPPIEAPCTFAESLLDFLDQEAAR